MIEGTPKCIPAGRLLGLVARNHATKNRRHVSRVTVGVSEAGPVNTKELLPHGCSRRWVWTAKASRFQTAFDCPKIEIRFNPLDHCSQHEQEVLRASVRNTELSLCRGLRHVGHIDWSV